MCRLNVRRWAMGFLAAALPLVASCGSHTDRREVFPTSGELFVQGAPAAGARIAFRPVEEGEDWPNGFPYAIVEDDGKFAVSTYGNKDGCPPGKYTLVVTWPQPPGPDDDEEADPVDRLQGRYASPDTSQLRVSVEARPTQLERIDLQ